MVDTVRTQQQLLDRMQVNVAGVQTGKRGDVLVQTLRDFVVSIPALGGGLQNIVEDTTPQLGGTLDMNTFNIQAANAAGPCIVDEAASDTNPTLIPNCANLGTGIGSSDINNIHFITNGIHQFNVSSSNLLARLAGGPAMRNTTVGTTAPGFAPRRDDLTTGVGGALGTVGLITGGIQRFQVQAGGNCLTQTAASQLGGSNPNAGRIINQAASATVPTLIPDAADINTGFGRAGSDQLSAIAGGFEVMRFNEVASSVNITFFGPFQSTNSAGSSLLATAPTATIPSIVPRRSDGTTGIGSSANGDLTLIGSATEQIRVDATGVGFFATTPVGQSAAYTRNATVVEDRTLLASASATTLNNNNVLAALIADLQAIGILG